jgi:hypothetical protein
MAVNKADGTSRTTYVVQTYIAGARGALKVAEQIPCPSEQNGRARAEKLMAAGRILGVDLVKQIADPEAGEYGEPEYLVRLGRVPELQ